MHASTLELAPDPFRVNNDPLRFGAAAVLTHRLQVAIQLAVSAQLLQARGPLHLVPQVGERPMLKVKLEEQLQLHHNLHRLCRDRGVPELPLRLDHMEAALAGEGLDLGVKRLFSFVAVAAGVEWGWGPGGGTCVRGLIDAPEAPLSGGSVGQTRSPAL